MIGLVMSTVNEVDAVDALPRLSVDEIVTVCNPSLSPVYVTGDVQAAAVPVSSLQVVTSGSVASVIVLLFWVFLSANIVIFGGAVAAEVAHVVHGEPTEGPVDWRRSLVVLLRGLVLAPDEE